VFNSHEVVVSLIMLTGNRHC